MAEVLPIRPRRQSNPAAKAPAPPRGLSPSSRKIWQDINARWLVDEAARPLLAAALECRDRYLTAAELVKRDGPTTIGSKGTLIQHPAHAIARDNLREFRQCMRQLNLEAPDAKDTATSRRRR